MINVDVLLVNIKMVHELWHRDKQGLEAVMNTYAQHLDSLALEWDEGRRTRPKFLMWLSAPAMLSEREPNCVYDRGLVINAMMRGVFSSRGWVEVDLTSVTVARGTGSSWDAMHYYHTVRRAVVHMILHHICHDQL